MTTINATHIDMRLRESTEDIIYTKVFPKVNQGNFYTGPLVKNVLSTLNFGLMETDMKLRRHHEDTILEFASTVAFDSFSLEQLAIPGFGKSDYIVKSNCGKGIGQGMRITLKVKYDSDKDEFEDPKDAFKFHCVGDRKKTPFKLALDRDQEVKGNWFEKKFDKLRGNIIAGVANIDPRPFNVTTAPLDAMYLAIHIFPPSAIWKEAPELMSSVPYPLRPTWTNPLALKTSPSLIDKEPGEEDPIIKSEIPDVGGFGETLPV